MRSEHRTSLLSYADALQSLSQDPDNPVYQHRAVLALARAGSLAFAVSEYERYGLGKVHDLQDRKLLEDIMALGGRLFKDLALAHTGRERKDYAGQSSGKYDAAFKRTSGYYSGINAATMALVAGFPAQMVQDRAKAILDKLPTAEITSSEDRYYTEATRAEALLLLGDGSKAGAVLNSAIEYDPQNYAAHASTIKQFRMILNEMGKPTDWLDVLRPPQIVHFAGHMFADYADAKLPQLSRDQIDALQLTLSDTIQRQDIGFGYGALAAGADILIAETLLNEGCELHVVLPIDVDSFAQVSVAPYGDDWSRRYRSCLDQASSLTIAKLEAPWPNDTALRDTSIRAMGDAIQHADSLSVPASQLLIWDSVNSQTGTGADAQAWNEGGRPQIQIKYPGERPDRSKTRKSHPPAPAIVLTQSDQTEAKSFDSIADAVAAALNNRANNSEIKQGLDINALGQDEACTQGSHQLADQALPGSILMSASFAARVTLWHSDRFAADIVGSEDESRRIYALRVKS